MAKAINNPILAGETARQALKRITAAARQDKPGLTQEEAVGWALAEYPQLHVALLCESNPGKGERRADGILRAVEGAAPAPRKRRR